MVESVTADLLALLNIAAMERLGDGSFRLIGGVPDWLRRFYSDAELGEEALKPEERFPFLESFLPDAENFWAGRPAGRLKSGPWCEADPEENQYYLEASAARLRKRNILLIESLGSVYEEKQALLQKLRESSLQHNRIVKEIRAEIATGAKAVELAGQTLNGKYELQEVIGQGGLGVVYRALDLITREPVAVKLLLEETENPLFSQQLFEREIKILKRVSHPNIVNIVDSGISPTGRVYLVMEFVKGEPLQKLIDEGGTWSVERTLNLLSQICPALHAMHQQNIIHRDMKPANIIIQKEGGFEKAVLLDLGIAKVVRGSNETALIKSITQTGIILGTLQYLAPEQCIAGELDHRVDIYALGIIVYELLTGDLPFQAYSTTAWLISHMQGRPIPLRSVNPSLSEEIEQVVLWALAKKREDRPSSAMEFLERFERAVRDFLGEPEEVFSVPVKLDLDGPPETFERGRITNPNEDNSTSVERGKRTLVSLPEE